MKITITLLLITLFSCTKSKQNCWHCSGNVPATGQVYTKDTCTPSGDQPTQIHDNSGNSVNFTCTHQ